MMHNEPADALGGPSCAFVCHLAPIGRLSEPWRGSVRDAAEGRSASLSIPTLAKRAGEIKDIAPTVQKSSCCREFRLVGLSSERKRVQWGYP
ncbi:hypothetical protein CC86DRAFT_181605 [Ophiobolus disseminans]|uniref:Uncharacterized protein n=1 Tax=Ophiobolus disseminans TaxID=1469910 RepID=A0A6A7AA67_9PLEO|nr:hypothetical protein CC86DRAFT_181605 [Ophiobolus disseminans]